MDKFITHLSNGTIIVYDKDSFGNWCVKVAMSTGEKHTPKNIEYFSFFQKLCCDFFRQSVYRSFISIYDLTSKVIDKAVLKKINSIASIYSPNKEEFELWMTVLYLHMVAEENNSFSNNGKRLTRLCMHQIIIDKIHPTKVVQYCKIMKLEEIDNKCKMKGF